MVQPEGVCDSNKEEWEIEKEKVAGWSREKPNDAEMEEALFEWSVDLHGRHAPPCTIPSTDQNVGQGTVY